MGCILQETVEDYPILKALVADFDAAVTRMTIYKQYDWSFYVIIKELIKKNQFHAGTRRYLYVTSVYAEPTGIKLWRDT